MDAWVRYARSAVEDGRRCNFRLGLVLVRLERFGGVTPWGELRTNSGVAQKGGEWHRLMREAIRNGFVEIRRDPEDGRAKVVHLTETGRQEVENLRVAVAALPGTMPA